MGRGRGGERQGGREGGWGEMEGGEGVEWRGGMTVIHIVIGGEGRGGEGRGGEGGEGGRGGEGREGKGRGGEGRDDGYTYCNRYVH